jgi:hypothetical protein
LLRLDQDRGLPRMPKMRVVVLRGPVRAKEKAGLMGGDFLADEIQVEL